MGGDHGSGDEQQRIARQEGQDDEPGLQKNHQGHHCQRPDAVLRHPLIERPAEGRC